jgi:protein-serine/threonine kinase
MTPPPSSPTRTTARPVGPRPRPDSPPAAPVAFAQSKATHAEFGRSVDEAGPSGTSRGTLPRGTVLHKGFYDLLSILPNTASQLRAWKVPGNNDDEDHIIAGPRYDEIPPPPETPPKAPSPQQAGPPRGLFDRVSAILPPLEPQTTRLAASISAYFASPPSPTAPTRPRRISKDMISSPTGFMYVLRITILWDLGF